MLVSLYACVRVCVYTYIYTRIRVCHTSVIINIPSENIRGQARERLLHRGRHFSPTLASLYPPFLSLLFPFIRAIIALQFGRCAPPSLCSFRMLVVSADSFVVNSSPGIYIYIPVLVFFFFFFVVGRSSRCKLFFRRFFRDKDERGGTKLGNKILNVGYFYSIIDR